MGCVSFYNTVAQALTASPTALNLIGNKVVDKGCGVNVAGTTIAIGCGGVYEININAIITATTAGAVTLVLYNNGIAMPDTARTVTAAVGNTEVTISALEDLPACRVSKPNITVMAYGAAVGSVAMIEGNVSKL